MATQAKTVLYVEDDPDHRTLVTAALTLHGGYRVLCARDGEEGLAMAREEKPDIILMDVTMPELGGLSVMAQIQADQRLCGIPVVLLTARARPQDVERGMAAGARDYVTKPFDALRLADRLGDVLRGSADYAAAL